MATTTVPKTFGVRIRNNYKTAKNLCLFSGTVDTDAIALLDGTTPVFTKADPRPVIDYSQSRVDLVMADGILPMIDGDNLTIPSKVGEDTEYMEVSAVNPQFPVKNLKSWLKNNFYLIKKIVITVTSQQQFDNPILFRTSSPTENLGNTYINPTNYSTPDLLNKTKIEIKDIEGTVLQDDTMMFWLINAGEVVNITFEFTEPQA